MEVKKTYNKSGFAEYTVDGSGLIKIVPPYTIFSDPWAVRIPNQEGYNMMTIYRAPNLKRIKEFLSEFSTEEELLKAYCEG